MQKKIRIWCVLPAFILASYAAAAAEPTPVQLVGAEKEQVNAEVSPVDSALSESMEAPVAPEKEKPRATPVKATAVKAAREAKEEDEADEEAAAEADRDLHPSAKGRADDKYEIQAGDVLQITVWKEADMDREVLVLPDGQVSFPLIGSFKAEGLTPAQVQATIKRKLAKLIPDASVTVLVKATLGHSVSVIGQVTKPGELVMAHGMNVMQALSQAGGLTPFASEGSIIILRHVDGKETSIPFPYDDVIRGHNLDKNIELQPGDVVVVPTAGLF